MKKDSSLTLHGEIFYAALPVFEVEYLGCKNDGSEVINHQSSEVQMILVRPLPKSLVRGHIFGGVVFAIALV